jgi:hypothetical protein
MLNIPEEIKEALKKVEEEQDKPSAVMVSMWALGELMTRGERMHALADEAKELHKDKEEIDRLMKLTKIVLTDGEAEIEEHNCRAETLAIPVPKPIGGGPASSKPNFEA